MNNEEKILAILEEHSKQFELINKRFDEQEVKFIGKLNEQEAKFNSKLDEQEAKFNSKLDEQEARFNSKLDEQEARFNAKFDEQEARFDKIDEKLDSHTEDIKTMKASIINLEEYVMEKIPALFDAITVNSDKHETYDEHIASLNAKTFNHNIRISALEDTLRTLPA